MPQNPDVIATKTTKGDVWVFDRTKHPSKPDKESVFKPDIILNGMNKDGYVIISKCAFMSCPPVLRFGLAWSELKMGHIISSGEDTTVCKWFVPHSSLSHILRLPHHRDINASGRLGNTLRPTQIFKCHDSCVNVRDATAPLQP